MSTPDAQQAARPRRNDADEDALAATVMVEFHRMVKQATLYVSENEAQRQQILAVQQAVLEFGRQTGSNPRIYFADKSVYIGRRLFRAGRHVYEAALDVASVLARFGIDEIAIGYDIQVDELKSFQQALGLALRNAGPPPQTVRYSRLRLRKGRPLKARRMNEQASPQEVLVRSYCLAVVAVRRFLESVQRGKFESIQNVQRVAEQLVDITNEMTTNQSPAFLAGVVLYNVRHESAGRAVNAALLSLAMARKLTEQLSTLSRIAIASLLYDVGLPRVAGTGPDGEDRVGVMMPRVGIEQERELPAATAMVLTALSGCSDAGVMHTALVYEALSLNLRDNAQPAYGSAHPYSLEARVVATSRRFTELLADADEERTAEQAMMAVLGETRDEADRTTARLLMAALGMYPTGTMVELSTGQVARVVRTPNDPKRFGFPVVVPVLDASGGRIDGAEPIDLEQACADGVRITRVVALGSPAMAAAQPRVAVAPPRAPAATSPVTPASRTSPATPHTPLSLPTFPVPRTPSESLPPLEAIDFGQNLGRTADTSDALALEVPEDGGELAPFGAEVQTDAQVGISETGDELAVDFASALTDGANRESPFVDDPLAVQFAPEADDALDVGFQLDEELELELELEEEFDSAPPAPPPPPPAPPRIATAAPLLELSLDASETMPSADFFDEAAADVAAAFARIELSSEAFEEPLLDEDASRRMFERAQPTTEWFEERADGLTPTAQGGLKKTPLIHLLVYLLDQRLSGTVVFAAAGDALCAFQCEAGVPSKVRAPPGIAPLDEVLASIGLAEAEVLEPAVQAIERTGELLGAHLVNRELIDPSMLEIGLNLQASRKLEHMFELGEETSYMFFAGHQLLASYGGTESTPVDPLALITAGVRRPGQSALIEHTLGRLANLVLSIHPRAEVLRLGFEAEENSVIELLLERPRPLAALLQTAAVSAAIVKRTVYTLAITRSLNLGAQARPPVGVEVAGAAPVSGNAVAPPSLPPSFAPHAGSAPGPARAPAAPLMSPPSAPPAKLAASTSSAPASVRSRPAVEQSRGATVSSTVPSAQSGAPSAGPLASGTPAPPAVALGGSRKGLTREEVAARAASLESENFFQLLGVDAETPNSAVQSAYFSLAKVWHPDRSPADLHDLKPVVAKVFARITEAFQTLTDAARRAAYLESLKSGSGAERDLLEKAVDSAMMFQKAEVLFKRGSLAQAELILQRCVDSDPQPEYLSLLAWVQVLRLGDPPVLQPGQKLDRYVAHLKLLDQALALSPDYERGIFYRAEVHKRSGAYELALHDYKRVAQLNPRNIDAARELRLHSMRKQNASQSKPGQAPTSPQGSLFGKLFKKE